MPLHEAPRFRRAEFTPPLSTVSEALAVCGPTLGRRGWLHCGYLPLAGFADAPAPCVDVTKDVDNGFRLDAIADFESVPAVVTTGVRSSRFAPVIFWEILHALAPGGTWIDIDETSRCSGTPLIAEDLPARAYFRECLQRESRHESGSLLTQVFTKRLPSPLAAGVFDDGWTFGILTAGPSPTAAAMARAILRLDLPAVDVIFCGPKPAGLPDDERIRAIDLDQPEPRGWITRKKNLIAEVARHENLCLLHDRYVVTPKWAAALKDGSRTVSVATLPHVYYPDADRRFPQRYPDYQVLRQSAGLADARRNHVYDAGRICHPAYDDFHETAFCCGGLYITKRTLWNRIRQDEGLFHSEWEDISFGLECQSQGIPHRVQRVTTAESTVGHPMLLTRLSVLDEARLQPREHLHVSMAQAAAAASGPTGFKPVIAASRDAYYARVVRRYHAIPGLKPKDRLQDNDVAGCSGLSDFWRVVADRASRMPLTRREDIAAVCHFLSDTVFKWPNAQLLWRIRDIEQSWTGADELAPFARVIAWGTGSLFRTTHRACRREIAYVIDPRVEMWNTSIDAVPVRPPDALAAEDPSATAVVVFSCAFDDILPAITARGPFPVFRSADVVHARGFQPLIDLVSYFEEVERYYPRIFEPTPPAEGCSV